MPVGPMQILIVAVVVIVLFGTGKLAGLGRSAGRSLREFKEETRGLAEPAAEPTGDPASTRHLDQ